MRGTDLTAVIAWLEAGCDPAEAAKELRSYQPALSSQSLSLSEAWAENDRKDVEIERLKGLVAGIREIPQEPSKVEEAWTVERRLEERTEQVAELFNDNRRLNGLLRMERAARVEIAADLANETEACASICDEWAHPPTMRLRAGEMSGAEIRSVRAVLAGVADAIRTRSKALENGPAGLGGSSHG